MDVHAVGAVTSSEPALTKKQRVAVIGAGPCGLSTLWAFKDIADVELVCFEKQSDVGGQWNYDPDADHGGRVLHSSMYKDLWSNGPKETGSEYPDYTYLEHFGKPIPSYPPRAVIADYIKGRARKYLLERNIRFNSQVESVAWNDPEERFSVSVQDLSSGVSYSEDFHYVIIANGHFSVPEFPRFPGYDHFPGRLLHAKDFRDASNFKDLRVLVVGGSLSAEDIALQCCKFGAKEVVITNRAPMGYPWPTGVSEVPMMTHVEGSRAHFTGGQSAEVDVIISATGYQYDFPFLPDSLKLSTRNVLIIKNLYKGVFFVDRPELMYLGMQNQVYTFLMFDLQACIARDAIMMKFSLPGRQDMLNDIDVWLQKQSHLDTVEDWHALQSEYVEELNAFTGYCTDRPISCKELFDSAEADKHKGLLNFRNGTFRSPFTLGDAPPPTQPWIDCKSELTLKEWINGVSVVSDDAQSTEAPSVNSSTDSKLM